MLEYVIMYSRVRIYLVTCARHPGGLRISSILLITIPSQTCWVRLRSAKIFLSTNSVRFSVTEKEIHLWLSSALYVYLLDSLEI